MIENSAVNTLLQSIVTAIEIPRSYYEKAVARHRSLGEWLCRPESLVAAFAPAVVPQGSFRYGTVVRPLNPTQKYDLDNVTTLQIAKTRMSQKELKNLYGTEIKNYAMAHKMTDPIQERNRCWRLFYADEFSFHLDSLPCVPEDQQVVDAIIQSGVPAHLAALAVAITDKRHPQYERISSGLFSSNPRGFAACFEECARSWALPRLRDLVKSNLYASVEEVPAYEFKTPLQQAVQILKRHRDVMFQSSPNLTPISMIITNLATHAYEGELDLYAALTNIVEKMPHFIRPERPRIPNPANPAEDYADKWSLNPGLERAFWQWHTQIRADLKKLPSFVTEGTLAEDVVRMFGVVLGGEELQPFAIGQANRAPTIMRTPAVVIPKSTPRPWGVRNHF